MCLTGPMQPNPNMCPSVLTVVASRRLLDFESRKPLTKPIYQQRNKVSPPYIHSLSNFYWLTHLLIIVLWFDARPQLSAKKVQVFFCFHSIQNTSKRVNTHTKKIFGCTTPTPLSTGAVNLSKVTENQKNAKLKKTNKEKYMYNIVFI